MAVAALVACSTGSSSTKDKYVGGKWLTRDPANPSVGFDVVFKEDNTFDGYLPGESSVKIKGPFSIEGENVKGTFTATSGGRVGRIEASLESGGSILVFSFIETNAFDNPGAVNGVITLVCKGPNPTKPASGGGGNSGSSKDGIPVGDVTWAYKDVTGWKVTATLSNTTVTPSNPAPTICWDRSYPSTWPLDTNKGKIDASMWVIGQVDGKWYGSVWEGVVPGTHQCSTTEAKPGDAPFIQTGTGPLNAWHPKSGDKVGFMVSTIARGGTPASSPNERSQILTVTWP
jgi:hypothetical protein